MNKLAQILLVMDLKMPVMDSYEATRQIRKFLPDLPIIVQTAYSSKIDKDKALAHGCTDFIIKPFKNEQLISKIKEHINKS
jgi:CheY-like chemotaxis protein